MEPILSPSSWIDRTNNSRQAHDAGKQRPPHSAGNLVRHTEISKLGG
jgi:hypothetical protein